MSLISKALKKVDATRQNIQEEKAKNIVYLTDAPQSWPRTFLMGLWIATTLTAIFLSIAAINVTMKDLESKKIQVTTMERTIKAQEKRIDDLVTRIGKNSNYSESQMRDIRLHLTNDTNNVNHQITALASNSRENFVNLKGSVINEQQEINFLNSYIKRMNQKIEALSIESVQVKDVTNPANGN